MISHADRTPTQPNRRQIIPEGGGSSYYVTVAYADEPTAEGAVVNKAMLDEFLAGSGVTTGTATALLLAQEGYALTDGAIVRFKAHLAVPGAVTLNVQSTGAKAIVRMNGSTKMSIVQHAWVTVIYSSGLDAYVLQGDFNTNPTLEGATLTGDINMGGHYIDNVLFR
jgi:hypothetical protein